jgi:hypothetical protein
VQTGIDVQAVIGVAGSPSCGVGTTLDLAVAARQIARSDHDLTRAWLNQEVVAASQRPGPGLFTAALQRQLTRYHCAVPFIETSLPAATP